MSDEIKKSVLNTLAEPIANSFKNITDKPTQNMGTTLADIWYLVFGGISQATDKRKLKYSYALKEFEKELKEKISKIPEDKLVEPDIQIVAPTLEASKYCIEKEELRKLFSKCIASSMNIDLYNNFHPSFPNILKHFSTFDAKIFDIIYRNDVNIFMKLLNDNINNFPTYVKMLSSSLIVLRNFGLIFGVKCFDQYSTIDYDDMFSPDCLYSIIANIFFYEDETLHKRIMDNHIFFNLTFSSWCKNSCTSNNLNFIKLTSLGEDLGKCCLGDISQ